MHQSNLAAARLGAGQYRSAADAAEAGLQCEDAPAKLQKKLGVRLARALFYSNDFVGCIAAVERCDGYRASKPLVRLLRAAKQAVVANDLPRLRDTAVGPGPATTRLLRPRAAGRERGLYYGLGHDIATSALHVPLSVYVLRRAARACADRCRPLHFCSPPCRTVCPPSPPRALALAQNHPVLMHAVATLSQARGWSAQ